MAKKEHIFAWSPLRTLMKESGAEVVARDAVEVLLDYLEERARKITETALVFTRHSDRKKVSKADVELAIEQL
jgi:histone H3/H4